MISMVRQRGYALLTAVWMVAILGSVSMVIINSYLTNTRAAQFDLQRIHADLLLNAGLRFAALGVASPRTRVVASAVPASKLVYRNSISDVRIEINNEAGLIDLRSGDPQLIKQMLKDSQLDDREVGLVRQRLSDLKPPVTYRHLRQVLGDMPGLYQRVISRASLHNAQSGVHPLLAPEPVLKLLPDLPNAERMRLMKKRAEQTQSLFVKPVESDFFITQASPYYRVTTEVSLDGQVHRRKQIIKMTNQPGHLFELVATL